MLQKLPYAFHLFHHFPYPGKAVGAVRGKTLKVRIFFDIDDGVDAEAGDAFFQPPVDHGI